MSEENFPQTGKCFKTRDTLMGQAYQKVCPQCSIWTSLPDAATLEVSVIFECLQYDYGKRIKG